MGVQVESGDVITTFSGTDVTISAAHGEVTLNATAAGKCVVASASLLHETDIVTHWNEDLNPDPVYPQVKRGGQSPGAMDALAVLDVDYATGNLKIEPATNPNPHPDRDPNTYKYGTFDYALLDDGSGLSDIINARVPSYERYIAENFSLVKPTRLAAIWLSDRVRSETGYPVAHRNGHQAFVQNPPRKIVDMDVPIPIFQVVHAWIVGHVDAGVHGNEQSLGTFVLPPGWSGAPGGTYPILFNGQYDIHSSGTFGWEFPSAGNVLDGYAKTLFKTLGALSIDPLLPLDKRHAIGIFWNGGGALGTNTLHESAVPNAKKLIQDAKTHLRADPQRVIFFGGSRGGGTALLLASNSDPAGSPTPDGFRAVYALADTPMTSLFPTIELASPSHPTSMATFDQITGYVGSWKSAWFGLSGQCPGSSLSGRELTLCNLVGEIHQDDAPLSSLSNIDHRARLFAAETRVIVRYGTHDPVHAYDQIATYYNRISTDLIPIHLDVFYRFGHQVPTSAMTDPHSAYSLMRGVLLNQPRWSDSRIAHYGRDASNYELPRHLCLATTCSGCTVPLVCETAGLAGRSQKILWSFVGPPGASVTLKLWNRASLPPNGTVLWDQIDSPPSHTRTFSLTNVPGFSLGQHSFEMMLSDYGAAVNTFVWYEVRYIPNGTTCELRVSHVALPPALNGRPAIFIVPEIETQGALTGLDSRSFGLSNDQDYLNYDPSCSCP